MHPHLNQPVSKSQNSEITEFFFKKCTNSDFYFLSFWGEKRRLDFSSRDFREKSHYPGCFHLPFFFYQTVCSLYLIAALCHMLTNAATITAAAQWK